jgi:DNA-directed RNA polymerase subunit RPC12/RpoP
MSVFKCWYKNCKKETVKESTSIRIVCPACGHLALKEEDKEKK